MSIRSHMKELGEEIHRIAVEHGFWEHATFVHRDPSLGDVEARIENTSIWPEKIALIHSEVSEMLEALRIGDVEAEQEECADVIIRVLDYCAARGFEIDVVVARKMEKNRLRAYRHGKVI